MEPQNGETEFQARLFIEIREIKKQLVRSDLMYISTDWIPRKEVMRFFSYGDTQMAAFEKSDELVVAKVGRRKFINRASLIKLIERNIQT